MASKQMRSYRLDEWTCETIDEMASELGISKSEVVMLAVQAMRTYEVDAALAAAPYRNNNAASMSTLIDLSQHGKTVQDAVYQQITASSV